MRKGKINFLWDVGSGVGRVEYPHHTIHDGNWHRIEASRYDALSCAFSAFLIQRQHLVLLCRIKNMQKQKRPELKFKIM